MPSKPTAQDTTAVTVIVPCRNEERHIADCMKSILAQETVPGGIEIIVADGMSTDRTREILMLFAKDNGHIRVVDNPGGIVSTGLNAAILVARGKIIIRMDAHAIYAKDYIRQCIEVLRQTGADNVGGHRIILAFGYVQQAILAAYQSQFAIGLARYHNPHFEGYVDTVPYGCWPREVFDRIGLFDEQLVRNQDDEFNLRLTRTGGTIWQSQRIQSWYVPRGSLMNLFRQYRQYGYWKVPVIVKHKLPSTLRQLVPGSFAGLLLILLPISPWWSPAAWMCLFLLSAYLALAVVMSTVTAFRTGWKTLPILPAIYFCFHFGYAIGFLRGTWDFLILRRGPSPSFLDLTRA
jgi:glycosyltransferase involved in cell wall biosynthesis